MANTYVVLGYGRSGRESEKYLLSLGHDVIVYDDVGVNQASFGKQYDGDCRPQTPALRLFPPPDGVRRDT